MMVTILTVINTNVGALMARTYSAKAAQRTTSSMERLASGKRINSAADDAAGLAVANKMESQQRGQKVGLRNSQDGISLSQTAESGMSKITHLMLRIRELAVQMDNGVYTQKDRDNAQMEVDALIAEIDKIAANTRFNDVALLDGTYDQYLRTGNHNDEITRLRFDSLFARDIGVTAIQRNTVSGPVETTADDFTINAADLLEKKLGINSASYSSLRATDSQAVLSDVVSGDNFNQHGGNVLLLKDNVEGLGYTYAAVEITDLQWESVSDNLVKVKALYEEMASLDPTNTDTYVKRASKIGLDLAQLEIERSQYIGSLFHAGEINPDGVFVEAGLTGNKYAEILNVYSDSGSRQTISGEIAAVEIDFQELSANLHNPRTCAHCIAQAAAGENSGAVGTNSIGSDGYDQDGHRYAALNATHTTTGSGYAAAPSGASTSVAPLISGSKWNNVGNDANHGNAAASLSYSYWDGSGSYNYDQGTRSTVASHGGGNEAAHNQIFEAWDAVSSFSLDEINETGDGNPIGDIRVSFTDTMPSGAAAFAYYPSSSARGGDIYYGDDTVGGTGTDFVNGQYGWFTALHEIGHALGLSHPFDGGSSDSSTLDLKFDSQRNTVMTYVQTDRNVKIAYSGGSASYSRVHTSTPGLLDIEAMEHLYGSSGWNDAATNGNDTVFGAAGDGGMNDFGNNYEYIRVITDSGGTGDTLDASAVTATGSIINLTPGTYSSINYYATQADKIAAVTGGNAAATAWFEAQLTNLDATASASNSYYSAYTREALYRGQDNVGIAHNTWIENAKGGAGNDTITGNSRANVITGNAGNDTIDGGTGDDIAVFSQAKSAYTISGSGTITVQANSGTDGTDTLTNIKFLKFSDGYYDVDDLSTNLGGTAPTTNDGADVVVTGGAANGEGGANSGGIALNQVKIMSQSDAQAAVDVVDRSLEQIAAGRAKLGAISNRLTHNIDNQTSSAMLTNQAHGRVVDSNMATESTSLAQDMILSRAGQQAINMATQRQLTVLTLLETV